MNIQPPPPSRCGISVAEPLTPALQRVKQMLFKPFDLAKWVTVGFCAWLAGLGESGGGGFNYNLNNHQHSLNGNGQPLEELRHLLGEVRDYVMENFFWIIPLAVLLVLFAVAAWVLVLWLSSRGKFMFLHCVALDRAEVAVPWRKFAAQANSLFWFRLILGVVAGMLVLPVLGLCVLTVLRLVRQNTMDVAAVMMLVLLGLFLVCLSILLVVIHKLLVDFVVPVMFLRGENIVTAGREFLGLLTAHFGHFTLYILFQIVLNLAIGVLVLLTIILTCCVAGCLMVLPFFGTVLLLPVLVFKRAYPLYYLAQYGPQWDVFVVSSGLGDQGGGA